MECKSIEVEPKTCKEGETKCIGSDLYQCKEGEWVLIEKDSPKCKINWLPYIAIGLAGITVLYIITRR